MEEFNYDERSHVWLEPFSAIIQSIFPIEIIYVHWLEYQEEIEVLQANKYLFFTSKNEDIETGSRVEGFSMPTLYVSPAEESLFTFSPDSVEWRPDTDTMKSYSHKFINSTGEETPLFTIEHVRDDKRYVRLKLTEEWKKLKPRFQDSIYLHQSYLLPMNNDKPILEGEIKTIHGPVLNTFVEGKGGRPTFDCDQTDVFTYPIAWPKYAMDWLVRTRRNGWPSPELIQDIFESSCHIAPIGRGSRLDKVVDFFNYMEKPQIIENNLQEGEMDGTEWRISFSVAENKLSNTISPVPRFVMVLLKLIKKMHFPDVICTYHLKNLLFWEIERCKKSFWVERNILKCLLHLLDRLQDCIEHRILMHYFVPESNLLSSASQEQLDDATKVVKNLRSNIVPHLLNLFRRLHSLRFPIKDIIFNLDVDEFLQRIQDGSLTQSQVKDLYSSVLKRLIKQLNRTVADRERIHRKILDEHSSDKNLCIDSMLVLNVYKSVMSRIILENWKSLHHENLLEEAEFKTLIRQETRGIESVKDIPSIEDLCVLYYRCLTDHIDSSEYIPIALNFTRKTLQCKYSQKHVNVSGLIGDQKDIVETVKNQIKELSDGEKFNSEFIKNLVEQQFKPVIADELANFIYQKLFDE